MKRRMTKKRTIIIKAVHNKKLSAFKLSHNERINVSATIKTPLDRLRLCATAEKMSLGTGGYSRRGVALIGTVSQLPGVKGRNQDNG